MSKTQLKYIVARELVILPAELEIKNPNPKKFAGMDGGKSVVHPDNYFHLGDEITVTLDTIDENIAYKANTLCHLEIAQALERQNAKYENTILVYRDTNNPDRNKYKPDPNYLAEEASEFYAKFTNPEELAKLNAPAEPIK